MVNEHKDAVSRDGPTVRNPARHRHKAAGRSSLLALAAAVILGSAGAAAPAAAQQLTNADYETKVNVLVVPFARLDFLASQQLYLLIPPSRSTVNTSGAVRFRVSGNALATMTAAPNEFITIPGPEGGVMGKALRGDEPIGYQLQLTFPRTAVFGSPKKVESLPLDRAIGTSPLTVDLTLTGGEREGAVDLLASPEWTLHGGLPLAGHYLGEIVLTLTADD